MAEALNAGKKIYLLKLWFFVNPLTPDKLRINGHFGPNPHEKCFLAWTVAASFGLRMFSILISGMRTIQNFEKLHRLRIFEI